MLGRWWNGKDLQGFGCRCYCYGFKPRPSNRDASLGLSNSWLFSRASTCPPETAPDPVVLNPKTLNPRIPKTPQVNREKPSLSRSILLGLPGGAGHSFVKHLEERAAGVAEMLVRVHCARTAGILERLP